MAYFLEVQDVSFQYLAEAKRPILDHAELSVVRGKTTVLIGGSGCGKSTLAALAAGIYPENGGILHSGTIQILGRPVNELGIPARTRRLSMMFQNPDLQFCMDTPRKELIFCLENLSFDPAKMDETVAAFACEYDIEPLLDRSFYALSGGEKQKIALCCLLLLGSEGIVLDEPFANLDPDSVRQVTDLLRNLRGKRDLTILAIDHRLDHWLDLADEIVVLGIGGRVLARGITAETLPQFRTLFEAEGLFYPEPLPLFTPKRMDATSALRLRDVTLAYGNLALLDGACADLPKGSMTALLGSSGAGKTTLFSAMLGQKKYGGRIELYGSDLARYKARARFQAIGAVFQNPANQFVALNVLDEVKKSVSLWNPKWKPDALESHALALLDRYGLKQYRRYSPYMLSQGQQRRLAVASVLAGGQTVLLLDEPTYGQDRRNTDAIMQHLRQLCEDGLTVLFSTHDLPTAVRYSDQILALREKRLQPWNG